MSQDMMRIIDGICRDKNIDRDSFISDLEGAMESALRKAFETAEEVEVSLDVLTGKIGATVDAKPVDIQLLGRIAAQTAKQVIIQKTRERERASIFAEFTERRGTILTGTVVRADGGNLLVNTGRTEGFLPRSEQIPGETHQVGERIRVLILEVREQPNQIKIILSRSHPEFILRLFELEVPEVAERIIEIKALAREAGYRTKVAVSSIDSKVDAVGACVGVRGSRIRNIVDELGGEKIDIVRWNESSQILVQNALKPAEVQEIALCFELGKSTVVVAEDQLSLAIGKRGQNVRLAARLTGWDVDILTPAEYNKNLEVLEQTISSIEGVTSLILDKIVAIGFISVADLDDVGPEPLVKELELDTELADKIVEAAGETVIRLEEEKEAAEKLRREREAAGLPPEEEPAVEETSADAAEGGGATDEGAAASETATEEETAETIEAAGATDSEAVSGGEEGTNAAAGEPDVEASSAVAVDADEETPEEAAEADGDAAEPAAAGEESSEVKSEESAAAEPVADAPLGAVEAGPSEPASDSP